jgi:uncharacterized protein YbaA (DUF1428 family)
MEGDMAYIDFVVTPVPKKRLKEYRALCRKSAAIWKKYGAIAYAECLADDVKPGKVTSFPQSVALKKNEVVGTAMITFKSKAHRAAVWKKVMKDPFMANYDMKSAPFDAKRMFFGGFKPVVMF